MANNNTNGGGHEVAALSLLRQLVGVNHADEENIKDIQRLAREVLASAPPVDPAADFTVGGLADNLVLMVQVAGQDEERVETLKDMFATIRDAGQLPLTWCLVFDDLKNTRKSFNCIAEVLLSFMATLHPHSRLIADATHVELLEGVQSTGTRFDKLKD